LPILADVLIMDAKERRTENRVNWRGRVQLILTGYEPIAANITDISEMGCGLQVDQPVASGLAIGIQGEGFEADGIIRHCYRHDGGFRLGIRLGPVA
jgi:hypothetical protein